MALELRMFFQRVNDYPQYGYYVMGKNTRNTTIFIDHLILSFAIGDETRVVWLYPDSFIDGPLMDPAWPYWYLFFEGFFGEYPGGRGSAHATAFYYEGLDMQKSEFISLP